MQVEGGRWKWEMEVDRGRLLLEERLKSEKLRCDVTMRESAG
jgi:hypothetical protein